MMPSAEMQESGTFMISNNFLNKAYGAIYFLSDASSFTTGAGLVIDGGFPKMAQKIMN